MGMKRQQIYLRIHNAAKSNPAFIHFNPLTRHSKKYLISFLGVDGLRKLGLDRSVGEIKRVSIECRKTKTKVITLANQKGRRQSGKPIKTRSNYT